MTASETFETFGLSLTAPEAVELSLIDWNSKIARHYHTMPIARRTSPRAEKMSKANTKKRPVKRYSQAKYHFDAIFLHTQKTDVSNPISRVLCGRNSH